MKMLKMKMRGFAFLASFVAAASSGGGPPVVSSEGAPMPSTLSRRRADSPGLVPVARAGLLQQQAHLEEDDPSAGAPRLTASGRLLSASTGAGATSGQPSTGTTNRGNLFQRYPITQLGGAWSGGTSGSTSDQRYQSVLYQADGRSTSAAPAEQSMSRGMIVPLPPAAPLPGSEFLSQQRFLSQQQDPLIADVGAGGTSRAGRLFAAAAAATANYRSPADDRSSRSGNAGQHDDRLGSSSDEEQHVGVRYSPFIGDGAEIQGGNFGNTQGSAAGGGMSRMHKLGLGAVAIAVWAISSAGSFLVGQHQGQEQMRAEMMLGGGAPAIIPGHTTRVNQHREDGWQLPAMGPPPPRGSRYENPRANAFLGGLMDDNGRLIDASTPSKLQLATDCSGSAARFLQCFRPFTESDPTSGYVDFLEGWNRRDQLVNTLPPRQGGRGQANRIEISFATGPPTAVGRPAVRLTSQKAFGAGSRFVVDVERMPLGDGTWPAYWTTIRGGVAGCGWPAGAEIDMMEHIQGWGMERMVSTLHTLAGCSMPTVQGVTNNGNCEGNNGCGVTAESVPSGHKFNRQFGGIHVMEWAEADPARGVTDPAIKMWWFDRKVADTFSEEMMGLPAFWDKILTDNQPYVTFPLGANCQAEQFFHPQTFIIDTTFCGDWAGSVFAPPGGPYGPQGCISVVGAEDYAKDWDTKTYPEQSKSFIFNSIRIFSKDGTGEDWE